MPIRSDQGIVVGPWSRAGAQPPYPASAESGGVPGVQVAPAWAAAHRPDVPAMFVAGSAPHCLTGAAAVLRRDASGTGPPVPVVCVRTGKEPP